MAVLKKRRTGRQDALAVAAAGHSRENRKFHLILEAARELFLDQGFDSTSMELVARAARVSKATLYVHFEGKEALLLALVEEECRRIAPGPLWEPEVGPLDVEATLLRIARKFTALFLTDQGLAFHRLMTAQAERFPKIGRAFYEGVPKKLQADVGLFLRTAEAQGLLAMPDVNLAVTQFLSLVRGDLHFKWALSMQQPSKDEYEALTEGGVRVFLAAYARAPRKHD
jgi:AcrR family transcriptional regulator